MVAATSPRMRRLHVPLWELLDPREHGPAMAWSAALALVAAVLVRAAGWPLWQASALAVAMMVPAIVLRSSMRAALPTCQNTRLACAPLINSTRRGAAG